MIMCQKFYIFLLLLIFLHKVLPDNVTTLKTISSNKYVAATPDPDDEDEDDLDEDDEDSSEIDDDGRVYRFKNPRNSPSPLCPRNEEQASLFGQKCLRKCSADDDCKSKKKKCLCDGACGMSCIKPDRECPDLPEIELGTVSVTGRLFGDKATYSCQHGYHVVGLASRTCQADGQWAGNAPACKQNIYCLVPPTITNARHNALPEQTTFDLDSTIQYYCNTGYETNGFPRAKCLSMDGQASWYGPDINCEPKPCGFPNDISHGWHAGDCYTYGCRVQYQCADGFELVGKKERFCEADGNWSPKELPTCVLVTAVQCSPPANPANGKAIYTSCSYNSVVSYECKYGYVLVGEATRRCGADKKWTGKMPVCKEINCGHPGRLWNGWLENIEGGTGLGASIIFRCHEGMKLEGHSSTVCQIDGKWRYTLPNCSAPCVVPHVQQGRVYLISRENGTELQSAIVHQTLVQHGEELGVECQPQYEFLSNQTPVTCNNGTWTHIPRSKDIVYKFHVEIRNTEEVVDYSAKVDKTSSAQSVGSAVVALRPFVIASKVTQDCEPARCKHMPRSPRNGMVIAPKTDHGMKAIFKCKDGFTLKGIYFVECSYGNWTGEIPYCQEVYCPFPGYIDNGKVLLVGNMGLYDYRPYVRKVTNNKQIMYDCDKGYVLGEGPPGATCVGGRWSPKQLPRCLPGQHPRLRWSRKRRSTDKYREKLNRSLFARQFLKNYLIYHKIPLTYLQRPINFENVFSDLQNSRFKRQTTSHNKHKMHTYPIKPICRGYSFCRPMYLAHYRPGYARLDSSKFSAQFGHLNRTNYTSFTTHIDETWRDRINPKEWRPKNGNPDQLLLEETNQQLVRNNSETQIHTFVKRSLLSIEENDEEEKVPEKSKRSLLSRNNQHTNHIMNRNHNGGMQSVRRGDRNRAPPNKQNAPNGHISQNKLKKHRAKGPCEILSNEPYVTIDILKTGRDPNTSYSSGTVVRMTCGIGYGLNLPYNSTVKCVRGLWKPLKPECEILPCNVPFIENGYYRYVTEATQNGVQQANILLDNSVDVINETMDVENGKVVKFSCIPGFNIKGPTNLKCWHGDWSVTTYPECVPAPCELPSIHNGQYLNGYRAGLTIGNGSFVNYQCDTFYRKTNAQPIQCILGELSPKNPGCRLARPSLAGSGILAGVNLKNLTDDLQYRAGSDISQNGGLDFVEKVNSRSCGRPARVQGANLFKDGEPMLEENDEDTYPEGTEVTFDCVSNALGEKTTWRIICEDGSWIGRSLNCENEDPPVISAPQYAANTSCTFRNNEPNVVSFYNDQEIREDVVEFPPGVILVSRCADIGKYAMVGPNSRRCLGPDWDGQKPVCFGLNQENDYAMEKPPTILFRHQLGPIAQSNNGKLIVYPGTILHMECLWIRRFGNPKWNVSHSYRKYPEGWSTDPGRDSGLEYRLSIFHASKDDSGSFTCMTPARQSHTVEVVVKPVHCPQPPLRKGVVINNKNTKMNTKLQLSCHNSNALIGASEITCLPSGNWSHPFPVCENVECGDVFAPSFFNSTYGDELSIANLRVVIVSREVGGRAVFSCTPGFGLRGPGETVCLSSGEWALPFPTCIEVHCDPPGVPENGYIQGSAPYKAGDIVQFNCNPDFMMEGQPIIACQDNARWSGTIPKCVQACSYPGTTISGRMSAVKFYYKIGETITFSCDEGLILRGAPMLRCLKNGKWSNAIPTCVNSTASLTQIVSTTKRTLPKSEQILFNY